MEKFNDDQRLERAEQLARDLGSVSIPVEVESVDRVAIRLFICKDGIEGGIQLKNGVLSAWLADASYEATIEGVSVNSLRQWITTTVDGWK